MTKPHTLGHYQDGYVRVEFCRKCGAEGLKLLEDCPEKIIVSDEKSLDEKKQTSK